jgi:hypothetical protein
VEPNPLHLMADADRERVVARLHTAVSEGRLTLPEFEDRISGVLAARTFGEIEPYVADLPGARAVAVPSTGPIHLTARGSSLIRSGRWPVPAEMHIVASGSSVKLDFTEAIVTSSVVLIDVELRGSSLKLTVPEGCSVETATASLTGSSAKVRRVSQYALPGQVGTHYVVTGELRGSSIKASPPRVWFWHRWLRRQR